MADHPDKKTSDGGQASGQGGGSKKTLIALLGSVLFCVGSSVTVGILAFPDAGAPAPSIEHAEPLELIELPVPKLLVNLTGANRTMLLSATVTLEIEVFEDTGRGGDINAMLPRVQDQLNKILSSLKEPSLTGGSNMDFLQTRIKDHINNGIFAGTGRRVINVYFIEWVIQS